MVFSNKDEITRDKYKNTTKPNKQNIFLKKKLNEKMQLHKKKNGFEVKIKSKKNVMTKSLLL